MKTGLSMKLVEGEIIEGKGRENGKLKKGEIGYG